MILSLVSCGIDMADGASFNTRETVVVESSKCFANCFRVVVPLGNASPEPASDLVLSAMGTNIHTTLPDKSRRFLYSPEYLQDKCLILKPIVISTKIMT